MNDELRQQLSDELPSNVPFTLDVEATIRKGRRRRRRKSLLMSGGATTTVAAVAALVLNFGAVFPPAHQDAPAADGHASSSSQADPTQEAPTEIVLPEVAADENYNWKTGLPPLEVDENTREYEASLREAMDLIYPGYERREDTDIHMVRSSAQLLQESDAGAETVIEVPIFTTNGTGSGSLGEDQMADMSIVRFAGADQDELFKVSVWPAADYKQKLEDTSADLLQCVPKKPQSPIMCANDEVDGQPFRYRESQTLTDGNPVSIQHQSALFRDDGTVVVIDNVANADKPDEATLGGREPTTQLPDHLKLAAKLSDALVI